jgi:hypothetical protein
LREVAEAQPTIVPAKAKSIICFFINHPLVVKYYLSGKASETFRVTQ